MNADGQIFANNDLISGNLFAYCSNNPVIYCDPTGQSLSLVFALVSVACTIVGLVCAGKSDTKSKSKLKKASDVSDAVSVVDVLLTVSNEKDSVEENKRKHCENVANSKSLENGELLTSPDTEIYGNDETYTINCIKVRENAYLTSCISDDKKTWSDLNDYEKQEMINTMPYWDFNPCFAEGMEMCGETCKSLGP